MSAVLNTFVSDEFIEPSLADAPAIKPEMHSGRLSYVVRGIARVYSMQDAIQLLGDMTEAA